MSDDGFGGGGGGDDYDYEQGYARVKNTLAKQVTYLVEIYSPDSTGILLCVPSHLLSSICISERPLLNS